MFSNSMPLAPHEPQSKPLTEVAEFCQALDILFDQSNMFTDQPVSLPARVTTKQWQQYFFNLGEFP